MENNDTMDIDGEKDTDMNCSNVSTDGSDDMDSSEEEAQEKEWNTKKLQLQERIKNDKTDYLAYTELIDVLKSLGQLEELREVRESFSKEYPLSSELWLSWLEDEKKLATTSEEKDHVRNLFERALQDYLSVEIWLEYIQYSIGLMADGTQVESVRGILERSVTINGLHVSKGALLWELYREFEKVLLLSYEGKKAQGEEVDDKITEHNRRIAELFRRQLSVPLLDMEKTYEELIQWLDDDKKVNTLIDLDLVERGYKKSLDKLSKILSFEENLLCIEPDKSIPLYESYIAYEKNSKEGGNDPFRVRSLYERAITDDPLKGFMWDEYISYTSSTLKIPEDVLVICQRAVRNCPNEANLWKHYMIELERFNRPKSEITDILNKGLEGTIADANGYRSLWLSYLYCLNRQLNSIPQTDTEQREKSIEEIRKVLDMAFDNIMNYFGASGDTDCEMLLWWARFEAETAHNLERYRTIWTDILNMGHDKSVLYWVKYINMEWQYGDAKHFRRLCSRALNAVPESPRSIVTLWLEYESHKGSLDSFQHCQRICDEKMKTYYGEKSKAKEKKIESKDKKKVKESFTKPDSGNAEFKVPKPVGKSNSKPDTAPEVTKKSDIPATTSAYVPHDSAKDGRTIFISNLEYTVTEDDVRNALSSVGTIEEFRLVRDYKGRSKGYGYLVFATKKEAVAALKLDRTPINQRPMFVSECDPDKQTRKSGLRFSTGLEKNKLFVKGLPVTLDKEAIEKLFNTYGTLKDVRIVTYRNGHSKGLAYVEYEDEVSAAHALLKTDGLDVEGHTLAVAISNPPERKNNLSLLSSNGQSISEVALGGGGGSGDKSNFGLRGRGRTQLSFLPRSVKIGADSKKDNFDKMDVEGASTAAAAAAAASTSKGMSNADFKNLLFGNKK